jgi:NAD(P)-dependent dehydrogenase (short-subunit alcohol dehydrogenase family)
MDLKGKVIVVTGAGGGLGASIANRCLEASARVVLADRDVDAVQQISRDYASADALPVGCDVSQMSDLSRLVEETLGKWGRIDGLVNNAGVNFVKPFLETTEQEWDHVMNVDLKGAFFLTQLCARQMIGQSPRGGSIVQIASVHTVAAVAGAGPYDAAKHGVVGFSKAAAVELADQDVRINILSPGLCRTGIWQQVVDAAPSEEECLAYWNSNIPGGRPIEPREIANAVLFLLSDASSAFVGSNLIADLGMTSLLINKEPYASKAIGGK